MSSRQEFIDEMIGVGVDQWLSSPATAEHRQRLREFVTDCAEALEINELSSSNISEVELIVRRSMMHNLLNQRGIRSENDLAKAAERWSNLENRIQLQLLQQELELETLARSAESVGDYEAANFFRSYSNH